MNFKISEESVDFGTLQLLPLGVIVVNNQGTILFYNQREEQISGRSREEVVGQNFFRDVAPCSAVKAFQGRFQELMVEATEDVEFDFVFPFAREPRQVRINLHPFWKDGESLCIIFVADVTEREQLREQILQRQRFSELGEVAAKVAHNFNNLLSVIQMSAEVALQQGSPEVKKHLGRVLAAVKDGAALVNRCRDISQAGHTAIQERVDLNGSVRMAVDYARQFAGAARKVDGRDVELLATLAPGELVVRGDGGELREVLVNLLRNAIEATPGKGTVRILSSRKPGTVVVDIIDTGLGMNAEVLQRLFTPMFTTKGDQGTGLGLASALSTLRRHGGTIVANSHAGAGSHFRITLPEADPSL
jgi:photoactive yellow protein